MTPRLAGVLFATVFAGAVSAQAPERFAVDLRGTVTDVLKQGRVRVTVWHQDMNRIAVDPIAEGYTDGSGAFLLRDVAWFRKQEWGNNSVLVVAQKGDRVDALTVRGDKQPIDKLELELDKAIDVSGVLRDVAGEPIANAWVYAAIFGEMNPVPDIWLTAPLLPWSTRTDAEGKFVLKGLPNIEPMRFIAGGMHHARRWIEVKNPTELVEAELQLGGRITGKVLMPDGKPAKRVLVRASGRGVGTGHTLSDDHGRFELSSLAADLYKVYANAENLTVIAVQDIRIGPGDVSEDEIVQLVEGGFIVGRIIDAATGKPFVPGPWTDVAMYGPARGSGGACQAYPVQADGTFRIRAPAGRNRIYLRSAMGYNEPSEHVEVEDGKETEVIWQLRKPKPRRK